MVALAGAGFTADCDDGVQVEAATASDSTTYGPEPFMVVFNYRAASG